MQNQNQLPQYQIQIQSPRAARLGLLKVPVGSAHMVKGKDGVGRYFDTADRSRFPKAKTVCRCLTCNKDFPTEDALIEAHPSEAVLVRQNEKHVYGFWSDDPMTKDSEAPIGLLSDVR